MNHPPKNIAHRGASHFCRENTMAAFARARADGAVTVECDLRLTAGGEWVVHHDAEIIVGGEHLRIADLTTALISEIHPDASDEPIPTLTEFMSWANTAAIVPVLDIKDTQGIAALIDLVEKTAPATPPLCSSFRQSVLQDIHALRPEWPTALIVGDPRYRLIRRLTFGAILKRARRYHCAAVHLHERWVTPSGLRAIRDAGLGVSIWTVDDPLRIALLANFGVDGIITNRPDVAGPVIRQIAALTPQEAGK